VNEVLVCNASDAPVLVYEGEIIEGARQNRTIDQPVLVPAGVEVRVGVSCVEQGRWDARNQNGRFVPSDHATDPGMRAAKRAAANRAAAGGCAARPDQADVWRDVARRLDDNQVASGSGALTDVYRARQAALRDLRDQLALVEDQLGAVVQINGRTLALDFVSRPRVFAELFPRLADGYALMALDAVRSTARADTEASAAAAHDFLRRARRSRTAWIPTAGRGDTYRLTSTGINGCALTAERELICLSAFPA
jgi:hypothetical protein